MIRVLRSKIVENRWRNRRKGETKITSKDGKRPKIVKKRLIDFDEKK
jgi:hypothetical protein